MVNKGVRASMINALTAERPPRRSPLDIAGRVVGGLVVTGLGLVQGLFWLLVAGFRCDESCDDAPTSWHGNADAWQWSALGWLGVGCFALCVAFAVSLSARRPHVSAALLAASALTGIAPWILQAIG
jgi:hypothetical protein